MQINVDSADYILNINLRKSALIYLRLNRI